jgi:hypothetical protein
MKNLFFYFIILFLSNTSCSEKKANESAVNHSADTALNSIITKEDSGIDNIDQIETGTKGPQSIFIPIESFEACKREPSVECGYQLTRSKGIKLELEVPKVGVTEIYDEKNYKRLKTGLSKGIIPLALPVDTTGKLGRVIDLSEIVDGDYYIHFLFVPDMDPEEINEEWKIDVFYKLQINTK